MSNHKSQNLPPVVVPPPGTVQIRNTKVLITCPWYKSVCPVTAFCVAQLADKRRTAMMLNFGDAFLVHCRNHCADYFLKSSLEWMITLDDDLVVPFGNGTWYKTYTGWHDYPEPFASFNTIDRLLSHNKTLVGGLYYGKHSAGKPVFAEGVRQELSDYVRQGPRDEILPTKWVGTGCMLIHRSVYEDIEKKFPNLARNSEGTNGQWFTSSEHSAMDLLTRTSKMLSVGPMDGTKAMKAYEMLEAGAADARANSSLGMGEDVQFCIRAKSAGHQPYVDIGLVCGHIGAQTFGAKNTGR